MASETQPTRVIKIFYSYSHKDKRLRSSLEEHLVMLRRDGIIKDWHDQEIGAGEEWRDKIDEHLDSADLILLLVSSHFLASKFIYSIEVKRAMDRHEASGTHVIPIILRPCDWENTPFGKLQALPDGAKPVEKWKHRNDAYLDIVRGIRRTINKLNAPDDVFASSPASQTPSPPSAPRLRSIIPRSPAAGFIARQDVEGRDIMERLKEELAAPERNRLITLWGLGGIGKTTLAAEAARMLEKGFGLRVVWSGADGRPDFRLTTLLADIATQLGREDLRRLADETEKARLARELVARETLIVMDNYETIAPDAQIDIENWFGPAECSALFTSRRKIPWTMNIPVPEMSPDETRDYLERLVEQTPDRKIFSDEIRERIRETAGANPFVMKWITAQIDAAREPVSVFEELKRGEGDVGEVAERVFDRSFNLPQLGDDGRAALLALSLFMPSATREALATVAGFGQDSRRADKAITKLYALWLIKGMNEYRRFAVEGLTRDLARTRMLKDERASEFRQRFVKYFRNYTEEHATLTQQDFGALEAEKGNVLGAMDVAFGMGDWSSMIRIADVLAKQEKDVGGLGDDVMTEQVAESKPVVTRFAADINAIPLSRGEHDEARRTYEHVLAVFRELGSEAKVAFVLRELGWLAQIHGEMEEARRLYSESLEIGRRLENQYIIARSSHRLAMLAQARGELEEARSLYNESLEIKAKLNDQSGIAHTLGSLGLLAEKEGDKEEAVRLLRKALGIFEELKAPYAAFARRNLERLEKEAP